MRRDAAPPPPRASSRAGFESRAIDRGLRLRSARTSCRERQRETERETKLTKKTKKPTPHREARDAAAASSPIAGFVPDLPTRTVCVCKLSLRQ